MEAGINEIEYFILAFSVFESDLRTHLFDSEVVELKTSSYATAKNNIPPSEIELLNEGGIRIVALYVDEGYPGFAKVATYIENNYGTDITVSLKSI